MTKQNIDINQYAGKQLYQLRLAKGFSREKLAVQIGVTQQQLAKYEKGVNKISLEKLILISELYGVPITFFIPKTYRV